MKISSSYVGVELAEYRTVVNWRDTMNYAAAVGDNNPHYFNDERQAGIVAPPMFSVAATWQIVEHLGEYLAAADFPVEILRTQVHYSEHLEFHAPIKPSDELTIKGKIAAILPHRAGTHIVLRFEAVNQDQQPVFTEYFGGMMRGVTCEDGGAGGETLPVIPVVPDAASSVWEQSIPIDALRAHIYDGCTNIVFPIHTSRKFAREVGLPDILLQGTATLAYAARELLNRNADCDPSRLKVLACRYSGMVFPGTDIKVQLLSRIDKGGYEELFFRVLGDGEQVVINDGYAKVSRSEA